LPPASRSRTRTRRSSRSATWLRSINVCTPGLLVIELLSSGRGGHGSCELLRPSALLSGRHFGRPTATLLPRGSRTYLYLKSIGGRI
jgi:hypothetical protein